MPDRNYSVENMSDYSVVWEEGLKNMLLFQEMNRKKSPVAGPGYYAYIFYISCMHFGKKCTFYAWQDFLFSAQFYRFLFTGKVQSIKKLVRMIKGWKKNMLS